MNSAATLGTVLAYGIGPFQAAINAADQGVASPEQQKMLVEIIRASVSA